MASAKKRVTTYLPNSAAPKMDGATGLIRCLTATMVVSRRASYLGRRLFVGIIGPRMSADLGGSSNNSDENTEDRRGEGFYIAI